MHMDVTTVFLLPLRCQKQNTNNWSTYHKIDGLGILRCKPNINEFEK